MSGPRKHAEMGVGFPPLRPGGLSRPPGRSAFYPLGMAISVADLRAFLASVDLGSVGRAASALGVTQSAVSKRVKSLETAAGAELLARSASGVTLTHAGELMVTDARRALAEMDVLERRLATLGGTVAPVRLASSPAMAEIVVPAAIAMLGVEDGPLPVELLVANSSVVRQLVAEGRADVGIAAADQAEELHPAGRPLLDDELVAVIPPGDPWLALDVIPASELVSRRLILRDPASHARRTLEAAVTAAGLTLADPLLEVGNPGAVKAGVRARNVPGILSIHAVDPDHDLLEVRPLEGLNTARRVWVLLAEGAGDGPRRVAERLLAAAVAPES